MHYDFCRIGIIERALIAFATIAPFTSSNHLSIIVANFCIVATDDKCHIVHAAIGHVHCILIEQLMGNVYQ